TGLVPASHVFYAAPCIKALVKKSIWQRLPPRKGPASASRRSSRARVLPPGVRPKRGSRPDASQSTARLFLPPPSTLHHPTTLRSTARLCGRANEHGFSSITSHVDW